MTIVHIVESFAGGVFNFLVNLTGELNGEQHIIIYGKRSDIPSNFEKKFNENVKMIEWKYAQREINPMNDLKALFELFSIMNSIKNYDVIHCHSSKAGILGRVVALLKGKKKITLYNPHAIAFIRNDISSVQKYLYVFLEYCASKMCNTVVATSYSEEKLLKKHHINNTILIFNGIKGYKKDIIEDNHKDKKFTIISVARATAQKNPKMFNEIAKRINDDGIEFVWIGDGPQFGDLKENNIKKIKSLSLENVQLYIAKADVFLSTSLWEGLSLSVLEAMALSKPLLLSDCYGNVDVVINNKNGNIFHTVEEATKYIKLYKNKIWLIKKYGDESFDMFNRYYSAKNMARNYLNLYNKIIKG